MTHTFINVSASKFSLNGNTFFKTFLPFYIDSSHIRIYNIYDSKLFLINTTHVSDITVDGVVYATATELINAIHEVLFTKGTSEELTNEQIELNRLAIVDLQNTKANGTHNHDNLYYTQAQVDALITEINTAGNIANGYVEGDSIKFFDVNGNQVLTIDAHNFVRQGVSVVFEDGILYLKNSNGTILSTTPVKARETFYDRFMFVDKLATDLSDLVLLSNFALGCTNANQYYFVSAISNEENFIGNRIYIHEENKHFDLDSPEISSNDFKAWPISIDNPDYLNGTMYEFNFWIKSRTENANTSFTALNDTPNSFTGNAGKILAVNESEDGVGFVGTIDIEVSSDVDNILELGSDNKPFLDISKIVTSDITGISNALKVNNIVGITEVNYDLLTEEEKSLAYFLILPENEPNGYDVFLLVGQSNMVGRGGPIDFSLDGLSSDVFQLARTSDSNDKTIIIASDPLNHWDAQSDDIGLGLTFGKLYNEATGRRVLLIPAAMGGTGFSDGNWGVGENLYQDAIDRANIAMSLDEDNVFKGILWHQGEKDYQQNEGYYESKLDALIEGFKSGIEGASNSFFILGRIASWSTNYSAAIDSVIVNTINRKASTAVVEVEDLSHIGDSLHFDSNSLRILGERYYNAINAALTNIPGSSPAAISNLKAEYSIDGILLKWLAPANNGNLITDYIIQYCLEGTATWTTFSDENTEVTNVIIPSNELTIDNIYNFRVAAINSQGQGQWSNIVSYNYFNVGIESNSIAHYLFGLDNPNNENLVTGIAMTEVNTTPVFENNYISLPTSNTFNGLLCDVDDSSSQSITVGMVFRPINSECILAGNLSDEANSGGASLFIPSNGILREGLRISSATSTVDISSNLDSNLWYFVAYSYNGNTGKRRDLLGGNTILSQNLDYIKSSVTRKIGIGNCYYSGGLYNGLEIAELIVFDVPLSDIQLNELYDRSKIRLGDRGIIVN